MRLPKLKLSSGLLRVAYAFFDVEASHFTASPHLRIVEYAFALRKLVPLPPGKVLDVGCAASMNCIPTTLAALGWQVTGIDIRPWHLTHPNFSFVQGDIRATHFADQHFDAVCAVSSLEHFGLKGRYGVTEEDPEGDVKSVREIWRILKPGGRLVVTLPFGRRRIIVPATRVYDQYALESLFSGWRIEDEAYWILENGRLRPCNRAEAGQVETKLGLREAVALLELSRPQ